MPQFSKWQQQQQVVMANVDHLCSCWTSGPPGLLEVC